MNTEVIKSVSNSKIRFAASLRSNSRRSKHQFFLVEGFREIQRYYSSTCPNNGSFVNKPFDLLFVCDELLLGSNNDVLIGDVSNQGTQIIRVSEYVFSSKLSARDRGDGLVGIAKIPDRKLDQLNINENALLAVLDGIEKPGNMGAILRCADAAGIDSVLVSDRVTDLWNPRTIRSSVGSVFCVDCLEESSVNILSFLRQKNIDVVVTSPYGTSNIDTYDWSKPSAVVLGCEQLGVSDFWMEHADAKVSLPMFGICDSLNVATCASVFFYFARLQREKFGSKSTERVD